MKLAHSQRPVPNKSRITCTFKQSEQRGCGTVSHRMAVPRIFWPSTSVALLAIAPAALYLLLVSLPAAERHRDELTAEKGRRLRAH
jgi:hypothetical protein